MFSGVPVLGKRLLICKLELLVYGLTKDSSVDDIHQQCNNVSTS
jgi:hypothetical protein